jgi:transcriptional regulator with XRE-family HTH domain
MPKEKIVTDKQVGSKIKKLRTKAGLTQIQFAKKAGISVFTLGRTEKGKGRMMILTLFRISKALKIELSDLLSGK